jgi:hypothetical protein
MKLRLLFLFKITQLIFFLLAELTSLIMKIYLERMLKMLKHGKMKIEFYQDENEKNDYLILTDVDCNEKMVFVGKDAMENAKRIFKPILEIMEEVEA